MFINFTQAFTSINSLFWLNIRRRMKAFTSYIILATAFSLFLTLKTEVSPDDYYTAAVFEHAIFRSKTASPEEIIGRNLYYYHKAASAAKSKGADVIVFPEYGIFSAGNRSSMKLYLENIPDPKLGRLNPCEEGLNFADRTILRTLSCMAKQNSMYIVANMGDIQTCDDEPDCPSDGAFHFNANVVFDREGTLVLKYHKEHLYFELGMDIARKQQDSTFQTDFGTFATYTCFDILFERMGNVSRTVDGILFPTMWFFLGPQFSSMQIFQGWAMGNNATLIGSNTHVLEFFSIGSGLFNGRDGAMGYTYNPDGISKVVVAKVPKPGRSLKNNRDASIVAITAEDEYEMKDDGKDVPESCWNTNLQKEDKRHCIAGNTTGYSFVKLTKKSDHLEACNNGMCCSLDYTAASELYETYYLGVFNGTYSSFDRYFWCEENCVLVRCEDDGFNTCSSFPMKAKTKFHHVRLSAEFSSKNVYPSVIESNMRLVPTELWQYDLSNYSGYKGVINMKNQDGIKLIAAGFKSRCYERDPPYVR